MCEMIRYDTQKIYTQSKRNAVYHFWKWSAVFFCIPINKGKQAAKAIYPIFVRRLLISNEKK